MFKKIMAKKFPNYGNHKPADPEGMSRKHKKREVNTIIKIHHLVAHNQ